MEVLFNKLIQAKYDKLIQGLDIVNYRFLYSACADDSTFCLRNIESVMEPKNTFKEFSSFFDLSPDMSKCELLVLKGVETAVCGMESIYLTKDAVKIDGISFSHNKAIQNELDCRTTIPKVVSISSMESNTVVLHQ